MAKTFSDNIIFYDAEFTSLNLRGGELLSIALVKPTGEELYLELDYTAPLDPWVEKNVIPTLNQEKISRAEARNKITVFIGEEHPYIVAYVNQFDSVFWYDLFESPKEHPVFWVPIDFATILFANGYDPVSLNKQRFFDELGLNREDYGKHNALDDARLLKDVYLKFTEKMA